MFLRSTVLRSGVNIPSDAEYENQIIWNRIRNSRKGKRLTVRALTGTRLQGWLAAGGILVSAAFFMGPWLWEEVKELAGYRFTAVPASEMPRMSPEWWENQWRSMNPMWRAGESIDDFFVKPFEFIKSQTGRDLSSAEAFRSTHPLHNRGEDEGRSLLSRLGLRRGRGQTKEEAAAPRVLVPLCGDSPILRTMALKGFEVDGVDSSETAMRTAVERTERGLPGEFFSQVHLHWNDFFAPELWTGPLKDRTFDVIYERQGMTSLERAQRADYVYLLKKALKDDGVMYVEGIFRTGRVRGNKVRGPPFSLSRAELSEYFPLREGYFVRCEEKTDMMRELSREDRVLQRVPKRYYVTPFNCVVFKEAAVNLSERHQPLQVPTATDHIHINGDVGKLS